MDKPKGGSDSVRIFCHIRYYQTVIFQYGDSWYINTDKSNSNSDVITKIYFSDICQIIKCDVSIYEELSVAVDTSIKINLKTNLTQ